MDWEECLKQKVKKTKPDPERAKSMKQLAERRLQEIHKRREYSYPEFIVEDYLDFVSFLFVKYLGLRV